MRGLGSGVERLRGWGIRRGRGDGRVDRVVVVVGEAAFVGLSWEGPLEGGDPLLLAVIVVLVVHAFARKVRSSRLVKLPDLWLGSFVEPMLVGMVGSVVLVADVVAATFCASSFPWS